MCAFDMTWAFVLRAFVQIPHIPVPEELFDKQRPWLLIVLACCGCRIHLRYGPDGVRDSTQLGWSEVITLQSPDTCWEMATKVGHELNRRVAKSLRGRACKRALLTQRRLQIDINVTPMSDDTECGFHAGDAWRALPAWLCICGAKINDRRGGYNCRSDHAAVVRNEQNTIANCNLQVRII